ncbi:MAG: hypothetical protein IJQ79_02700 [Bacteroidales bacterium]|nr:hypothetical protein [Bacteroidales bacterium]
MREPKFNCAEVYQHAKAFGRKSAEEKFGISPGLLGYIIRTGDELKAPVRKPSISSFTPRELMEELARRGYRGKLTYQQEIDITKF